MNCSPCASTQMPVSHQGDLITSSQGVTAGRICHLIPSLIALATCITGIALALVYKRASLTAPFAVGGGASLYLGYQSWRFGELQSMEVSAKQLASKTVKMGEEINRLEGLNGSLKDVNTSLHEVNTSLESENEKLKEANQLLRDNLQQLETKIAALSTEIQGLQKENHAFAKNNTEQKNQIEELKEVLVNLNKTEECFESLLKDSTALENVRKGNLDTLQLELGKLRKTSKGYEKVLSSVQSLIQFLDEKVQKEVIAALHTQISDQKKVASALENQVIGLKGVKKGLESAVGKLEAKVEELGNEINKMNASVTLLEGTSGKLAKHVKGLTNAASPPYIQG